jgi:hypothetical protein
MRCSTWAWFLKDPLRCLSHRVSSCTEWERTAHLLADHARLPSLIFALWTTCLWEHAITGLSRDISNLLRSVPDARLDVNRVRWRCSRSPLVWHRLDSVSWSLL